MQGNLSLSEQPCTCNLRLWEFLQRCLFSEEVTVEILVIEFLSSCMAPLTSGTNYLKDTCLTKTKGPK